MTRLRRYRARDLSNVSTLLYCQTEPVIESSKNVSFGCFAFAYMPLASQFVAAKLSPWDNRWSEVYDFTPNANGAKNFSLLEPAQEDSFPVKRLSAVGEWSWCVTACQCLLPACLPAYASTLRCGRCSAATEQQLARSVVPVSLGQRPLPHGCDSTGGPRHATSPHLKHAIFLPLHNITLQRRSHYSRGCWRQGSMPRDHPSGCGAARRSRSSVRDGAGQEQSAAAACRSRRLRLSRGCE